MVGRDISGREMDRMIVGKVEGRDRGRDQGKEPGGTWVREGVGGGGGR